MPAVVYRDVKQNKKLKKLKEEFRLEAISGDVIRATENRIGIKLFVLFVCFNFLIF